MNFKRKGDKNRYSFADERCIGRSCWAPGMYQHRGATLSGSRNTGSQDSPCCLNRAYHGCPIGPEGEQPSPDGVGIIAGLRIFQKELAAKRRAEGWKKV